MILRLFPVVVKKVLVELIDRIEDGTCGKIDGGSGGEQAKLGEYPFNALLGTDKNSKYPKFFCGGSLINTRYVLTAATCYIPSNPINLVRLGEFYLNNRDKQDCLDNHCLPAVQDFEVSMADFTIHPDYQQNYRERKVYNDIGGIDIDIDIDTIYIREGFN